MGGITTLVSNSLKQFTAKVGEGIEEDKYNIVRLDHIYPLLNIINWYGEQESKTPKEDILQSWSRLRKEIKTIEERGEAVMFIGDMNRAVGADDLGIKGNKTSISNGWKLIRDLMETKEFILLNNLDIVEGGPWTWISRSDPRVRSCLDLAIISKNLMPFVSKVVIDKDRKFTPYRVLRRKTGIKSYYTDHFSF